MQIVPILLIIVLFYALVILPQKKKQKKMNEFLDALKVGDRVVTGGGLVGTVTSIHERQVDLEIAPQVVVTVMKQAILTLAPDQS
jgi:preprotein translocase subunit YajC